MTTGRLASADLTAGEGVGTVIRRVRVGDGHVLVARLASGEVVAFTPVCPHQFTELDEATIRDGVLRCPRHGYLYDTRTGENIHPRREAKVGNLWKLRPGYLPCFRAVEEDGWISVDDQAVPPPASYDPALEERPSAESEPVAAQPVAEVPVAAPVSVEQSLKFLTVSSGTTFDVRLPIVPRPGFAWHHEVTGALLVVIEEQDEPGYSPCHLLLVAAEGVGAATLVCTYSTDQGVAAEVRTFIVRVQPA